MPDSYSAENIRVLEGMASPRRAPKYPPVYFDLKPKELHGITQEESDRRRNAVEHAIRLVECADLPITPQLLAIAARYISGELTREQYHDIVLSWK
jgi:Antitoxin VbhA